MPTDFRLTRPHTASITRRRAAAISALAALLLTAAPLTAHAEVLPTPESDDLRSLTDAADLGDGLVATTSDELAELLRAAAATPDVPFALDDGNGVILGLADQPTAQEASELHELIAPIADEHPELTVRSFELIATGFEELQGLSTTAAIDTKYSDSLRALEKAIKVRNTFIQIEQKLRAFLTSDDTAAFAAAEQIARDAGMYGRYFVKQSGRTVAAAERTLSLLKAPSRQAELKVQTELLILSAESIKNSADAARRAAILKMLREATSGVVGSMRSEPIALGTSQWKNGAVEGRFDLSEVPDGNHHLILDFADAGVSVVAAVTIDREPSTAEGDFPLVALLGGSAAIAAAGITGAVLIRRRSRSADA